MKQTDLSEAVGTDGDMQAPSHQKIVDRATSQEALYSGSCNVTNIVICAIRH